MTEETQTTPATDAPTGDAPGKESGEDKSARDLIAELGADDLDELLLAAAPDKFVSKDKVEDIVKERLNSEREQRKAEAERKALEEQNEFKALYEKERDACTDLQEKHKAEAESRRNDLIRYELRDSLRNAGINTERLPLALRLADTSLVEVEDSEVKGLEGVVDSLKKDSPEWFGTTTQDIPGSPPAGDPSQLSDEKRKEQAEIASRQVRNLF